jgi:hypothetical protein
MSLKSSKLFSKTVCRYLAVLLSVLMTIQLMTTSVLGASANIKRLTVTSPAYAFPNIQTSVLGQASSADEEHNQVNKAEIPAEAETFTVKAGTFALQQGQSDTNEIIVKFKNASVETLEKQALELPAAKEASELSEPSETQETQETPETPEVPEPSRIPESGPKPDTVEASQPLESGQKPDESETSPTPESEETSDISDMTDTSEESEASDVLETSPKSKSGQETDILKTLLIPELGQASKNSITLYQSDEEGITALIKVNDEQDLNTKLEEIRSNPQVEYAEPNYRLYATEAPNDPRYSQQWWLQQNNFIKAPQTWNSALAVTGTIDNAMTVVMAVLDTGLDYNHEDLEGRVHHTGYNAITGETGLDKVMDNSISGHGTLVAGIAAAATNNGIGIAGTAGEFPVKILPVKVLDQFGTGTMLNVARGIKWAADNGAKVINLSLGARLPDYPRTLAEAVKYAQDRGVLVVASGGNDGGSVHGFYPASLTGVISVGAIDNEGKKTDFTTYDCVAYAPGVNILSTLPGQTSDQQYGTITGTSASTPIVSATCALLWSAYPEENADRIGDSVRYGTDYYGAPIYDNVFSMLTSLRNVTDPYLTFSDIWFLYPKEEDNVAGTIEVSVQVENPDEVAKVVFLYGKNKPYSSSDVTIGTVINDGTMQSGIYTIDFDTTTTSDGTYYLKAVAYDSLEEEIADERIQIKISNELESGLSIKVIKPDSEPGSGAKVTVWQIKNDGTKISYHPINSQSFSADNKC